MIATFSPFCGPAAARRTRVDYWLYKCNAEEGGPSGYGEGWLWDVFSRGEPVDRDGLLHAVAGGDHTVGQWSGGTSAQLLDGAGSGMTVVYEPFINLDASTSEIECRDDGHSLLDRIHCARTSAPASVFAAVDRQADWEQSEGEDATGDGRVPRKPFSG
ncbi:hypothetical protein [Rhodococcus aetherivorans]